VDALKELQIIEVTAQNNRYFKKIAHDFWNRVINGQNSQRPKKPAKGSK